jgi:hypothetical protein
MNKTTRLAQILVNSASSKAELLSMFKERIAGLERKLKSETGKYHREEIEKLININVNLLERCKDLRKIKTH